MTPDELRRFDERWNLDPETGCHIWKGGTVRGYASLTLGKKTWRGGRLAYTHHVGEIPEGLTIDHLCREPLCVNPDHLEVVTMRENLLRGDTVTARNAAKTHCPQGHEYNERNTRIETNRSRKCRTCDAARHRAKRKGERYP